MPWTLVQLMIIDSPRYDSDSESSSGKDSSADLKLTKNNQEEVMNAVNAMMM